MDEFCAGAGASLIGRLGSGALGFGSAVAFSCNSSLNHPLTAELGSHSHTFQIVSPLIVMVRLLVWRLY